MHERTRYRPLRLAVAAGGLLAVIAVALLAFAACGGCGRRAPAGGDTTVLQAGDASMPAAKQLDVDATALRDPLLWKNAIEGDVEDRATLAAHEGAMGLVEASRDPSLRATAIQAMGYAYGWAQMPTLASIAGGKDDGEARLALASVLELATRPRRAEDPEDAGELGEGCEALGVLARDETRPRARRIDAIRALRMLPCPPKIIEGLPIDLDAK